MDRYDLDDIGGQPHPHNDGNWVKYDDVQAEIKRLTAEALERHEVIDTLTAKLAEVRTEAKRNKRQYGDVLRQLSECGSKNDRLTAERDAALKRIADAPHHNECGWQFMPMTGDINYNMAHRGPCDCWKQEATDER